MAYYVVTHGHGRSKAGPASRTYAAWSAMRYRCRNPRCPEFAAYGGRGIRVCDRWSSFEAFLNDMGIKPVDRSLDRIDNDGDYSPENCRWADNVTQQRNKRVSRFVTFNGETKHLAEWAAQVGVSIETMRDRIYRSKMTLEEALTLPVQSKAECTKHANRQRAINRSHHTVI